MRIRDFDVHSLFERDECYEKRELNEKRKNEIQDVVSVFPADRLNDTATNEAKNQECDNPRKKNN